MNKYVVTILVMVVLLVALAEIYLALSWDEHFERGRWNITLNWTLKALPDSTPEYSQESLPQFIYSTQTSTKTLLNTTVFNFSKTVTMSETAELESKILNITETVSLPNEINESFHPKLISTYVLREEPVAIDYNYPDCGFHSLE